MNNGEQKEKKMFALNIVGTKKHKGFGAGSIDLNNVSPVIIDRGEAYVDVGALHAKSKVEKGIKFLTDRSEVPDGRKCWVVWVAVDHTEEGAYYAGATACEMMVDEEARRGWKILADHVNKLDYALKRRFIFEGLDDSEKAALRQLLMTQKPEWWERSPEELKEALA